MNHFISLPHNIIIKIVKESKASNILRAVCSSFREVIKSLPLDESGWYGAIQLRSYNLCKFLMVRRAPIELYIVEQFDDKDLLTYRLRYEMYFVHWDLVHTSDLPDSDKSFDKTFRRTMSFYSRLKEDKVISSTPKHWFGELLELSIMRGNFSLVDKLLQRTRGRLIIYLGNFLFHFSSSSRCEGLVKFLYRDSDYFLDKEDKIKFTLEVLKLMKELKKVTQKKISRFLSCISKYDPNLYSIIISSDKVYKVLITI